MRKPTSDQQSDVLQRIRPSRHPVRRKLARTVYGFTIQGAMRRLRRAVRCVAGLLDHETTQNEDQEQHVTKLWRNRLPPLERHGEERSAYFPDTSIWSRPEHFEIARGGRVQW